MNQGFADAIVVLSGDGSDFARARHGVCLFHQGYAPTVVISIGSYDEHDGSRCSSAQQSLEVVQSRGLPPEATTIVYNARSTYEEATRLRNLVQHYDWPSLIVVTDLYHVHRAGRTFRTLLPDAIICAIAVPNPEHEGNHW